MAAVGPRFTHTHPAAPEGVVASHRTCWLALAGAVVVTSLATLGVVQLVKGSETEFSLIGCAGVVTDVAHVLPEPNETQSLAVKRRGEVITWPHQGETITGQDGRRYRQVRTQKTPSGYAYMIEETLRPTNC